MAGNRIILTEDDFADTQAATRPPASPALATDSLLPPVRPREPASVLTGSGTPAPEKKKSASVGNPLIDRKTGFIVAAVVGVVVAWLVTLITGVNKPGLLLSQSAVDRHSALWTAVIGLCYGTTVLIFDRFVAGAWEAAARRAVLAAIPFFAISYVAGYLAQAFYGHFFIQIIRTATSANDYRFYLLRLAGWAIFGLGIGLTVGLAERSRSRAMNGALGGALGGAAGGLVFQAASVNLHTSDSLSQLLGIAGVGGLIALATRAVEAARREAWIQVLSGGMAGKEFILYHDRTRIGSAADCEIFLMKDSQIAKVHAEITTGDRGRVLTAMADGVTVNGSSVSSHLLHTGDDVQIGSTVLGYSERASAVPRPPVRRPS